MGLLGALAFALAALSIIAASTPAPAMVRIADNHGGNMGAYWSRYLTLRDTGEQVVARSCWELCRMIEFASLLMRFSDSMPPGVPAFLAAQSSMTRGHKRFGPSVQTQFDTGSDVMVDSAQAPFICLGLRLRNRVWPAALKMARLLIWTLTQEMTVGSA
jgi:hypothetical protein